MLYAKIVPKILVWIWIDGVKICGKSKTPCVLKIVLERIWISPVVNKFIDNPTKNGFAFVFSVKKEIKKINKQQIKIVNKIDTKMFPVKYANKKNKNAERFIIPSQKTAKIPQSSENKVPKEINNNGVDIIKISVNELKKVIIIFPFVNMELQLIIIKFLE